MTAATKAYLVHLLTATGAVLAMLAMLEAVQGDWAMMFFWLVVAFGVDGLDGPLARKTSVKENAPRIDGILLDLIIDYLTYVFIPAFALFTSGLLPGWTGWFAIFVITFMSALYFADTRMKTADNRFSRLLEHGCACVIRNRTEFLAQPRACERAGDCNVPSDQVCASVSYRTLAIGDASDGGPLDVLCRLGGVGRIRSAKLGALGAYHFVDLADRRRGGTTNNLSRTPVSKEKGRPQPGAPSGIICQGLSLRRAPVPRTAGHHRGAPKAIVTCGRHPSRRRPVPQDRQSKRLFLVQPR